uniref:NADH-ubiquinone oxidoreductase chain 4L n=1 Tax=Kokeshia sp. NKU02 TaxID=1124182 RepID=A0A0X7YFS7_9HEMI|nr:NADH dehydrogenase subunit 4L [Kokeshia sp. NKU02]
MTYLIMLFFCMGLITFCLSHKHLLLTLISLEYLVIILFLGMVSFLTLYYMESYILLLFLTFSVCEGVIGLSVLVSLIRLHGNDMISSISFLSW